MNDMSGRYIAGHFIFKEEDGKFVYEALAEEPAVVVCGNMEKLYLACEEIINPVTTL